MENVVACRQCLKKRRYRSKAFSYIGHGANYIIHFSLHFSVFNVGVCLYSIWISRCSTSDAHAYSSANPTPLSLWLLFLGMQVFLSVRDTEQSSGLSKQSGTRDWTLDPLVKQAVNHPNHHPNDMLQCPQPCSHTHTHTPIHIHTHTHI